MLSPRWPILGVALDRAAASRGQSVFAGNAQCARCDVPTSNASGTLALTLSFTGVGPALVGGWLGGELVGRRGLSKAAVYRGEQGALHECSAVCPHLGCIVDWNDAEKTWDCPCHGSRFDQVGRILNRPANRDLGRVDG
jgi:Rieske Fe-S protein